MRAALAAAAAAMVFVAPAQAGEILLVAGCNDASGARGFGTCLLRDDASAPPRLVSREVAGGGFTPDGRGIVGETSGTAPGGFGNLATVQLDGTGYRLILDTPSEAFGIRPSPDGRTVAYWLFGGLDQPGVVRVVGADGSGDRQLGRGGFPRWLPGSDAIVYAGADNELHSVGLDGSGERIVTRGGNLLEAAVSPDGRRVAFSALMADGTQALHVMDADGSAARRLTAPAGQDTTPIWAPDSRGLLFNRTASLADSAKDLWRIDLAAGSAPRSLTASTGFTDQYTATAWHVPISPVAVASAAAADRAGPGVVLQGLGARAQTGRRSRLQFSVYDRSGVAAADIAIDGGRSRVLRRQSDFKRLVKRLTRGPHRLRFRARDGAGNRRTTTRRLTLR